MTQTLFGDVKQLLNEKEDLKEFQERVRRMEFELKENLIKEGAMQFLDINWGALRRVVRREVD